ncbi:MAG: ribose-phosphate pyrophosphokinase [Dehalococcoidia bacterium]|nr:ribose-phosphate pyrophosphokinase [Dehalococcoidia bacterium]
MEGAVFQELRIFSGNAQSELAQSVCAYLEQPLGECEVFQFHNENVFVRVGENVRQRDVFVIQTMNSPVNTRIMELLIMIDAMKRASAGRVTAVVPYYPYGRSDKKDQPRVPITARLLANLIETAGADRLLTMDLHAGQIQGFFNIPVDELTALFTISRYFRKKKLENLVVVATDVGASKRARNVAQSLNAPLAIIEKRRMANDDSSQVLNVIGEVSGRRALIVDDEIDTGTTIINSAETLKEAGVTEVSVAATHAIFSDDAARRLHESEIDEVVVTDTIPLPPEKQFPELEVLSIAELIGEAVSRIHTGRSIGELFEMNTSGTMAGALASVSNT